MLIDYYEEYCQQFTYKPIHGRLVKEFDQYLQDHDIPVNESYTEVYVSGNDLDDYAVKMTLLNMVMHGMRGVVAHMNTLTQEVFNCWQVTPYLNGGLLRDEWESIDWDWNNLDLL